MNDKNSPDKNRTSSVPGYVHPSHRNDKNPKDPAEMNPEEKKKDARLTYDYDKDVKYEREQYADNDLIDRPVNQAKRIKIKAKGIQTVPEHQSKDIRVQHKTSPVVPEDRSENHPGKKEK